MSWTYPILSTVTPWPVEERITGVRQFERKDWLDAISESAIPAGFSTGPDLTRIITHEANDLFERAGSGQGCLAGGINPTDL